jgi:acyl-CoA thioesterase-1
MRSFLFALIFPLFFLSTATPAVAARTVLVIGDSLSSGHGIRPEQSWPSLLGQRLSSQRTDYSVTNVSISGDTTAGGRSRLPAALKEYQPAIVIIELGANDGLRGLPIGQIRDNLSAMIDAALAAKAKVLLVGMWLPPNYGAYAEDFRQNFVDIARSKRVALLDFLLQPIALQPAMFQADGTHPVAEAQPVILDHVWPRLVPLLK